jgi:hypothetical protein
MRRNKTTVLTDSKLDKALRKAKIPSMRDTYWKRLAKRTIEHLRPQKLAKP